MGIQTFVAVNETLKHHKATPISADEMAVRREQETERGLWLLACSPFGILALIGVASAAMVIWG